MENIVIDLRIKVASLEIENVALKHKIEQMYKNWHFDYARFSELKLALNKAEFLKYTDVNRASKNKFS